MTQVRFSRGLWLLAMPTFLSPMPAAAECSASSSPQSVALLELYTSEGCSSCPPADQWLSKMAAQGYTSDRVIPLALHVDYWDYIGWKDRFAKPGFAERQRQLAGLSRSAVVYTPQVMFNGRDYRNWGSAGRFEKDVAAINRIPARVDIKLSVSHSPGTLEVRAVAQASKQDQAAMYVALYENGLTTEVKAGENGGATLHHDYVVLEWLGPYPLQEISPRRIALRPEWKAKNMGVAAFVQNQKTGEVLQALAMKPCGA